jgi:hypothetical protein
MKIRKCDFFVALCICIVIHYLNENSRSSSINKKKNKINERKITDIQQK